MNSHVGLFMQIIKEPRIKRFSLFGEPNVMIKCSAKMSIANRSKNSETPIRQCANDKLKESFSKETERKI